METLLSLLGFVLVATCTPGPNNLMVLTSGANFGIARTVPHILGIAVGFPLLILAIGFGLGIIFETWPTLHTVLKWVMFVYLLWLAWQIARAGKPKEEGSGGRTLTFFQAAAFQWVNPKAWAVIIGATALFTSDAGNRVVEVVTIAALFGLICLPNCVIWALFGRAIAGFLQDDRQRVWLNGVMALLLVASVVPTLLEAPPL